MTNSIRTRLTIRFLIVALAIGFLGLFAAAPASAQSGNTSLELATDLEPLLDKAREKGLGVVLIAPLGDQQKAVESETGWQEEGLKVRQDVARILGNVPNAWQNMRAAVNNASPDGTLFWLWKALGISALAIALSFLNQFWIVRVNRHFLSTMLAENPENRSEKIGFLLFRAVLISVSCAINFVIAMIVAIIFDYGHEPSRATIFIIVVAYIFYWVFRAVILFNIIAHDLPKHRMINLNDDEAKMIQFDWRNSMVAVIIAFSISAWFDALGLVPDTQKLLVILSTTLAVMTFGYLTIKHRDPFSKVVLGVGEPANKPLWRRTLATYWHIISIAYLAVAWVISCFRTVLELPSANVLVAAPIIAFLGGLAAYGIVLLIIDKAYLARQYKFDARVALAQEQEKERREQERAAIDAAMQDAPEDDEDLIINRVMAERQMEEMPAFKPVFKPLLEQAAGIMISIVAIGFILGTWDVNVGQRGNPVTAFVDTLMIAFAGWFLYRAVAAYIDNQLEEEGDGGQAEAGEPGEEMSGQGASRLTTLLPLIRNVMIAGIVILTAMVILSNMGVDIAPLFAGAGVIGLAIGFGAQTLIRDIFSGGFFLFDDAFRRGEYIELDSIKGTVEKISLRSFQLRHHNGPLHTIPFGEIKQLTNFSRDWVMMKLPLRLTYDTNVEHVRKLVKKLGQKLLEHPDIGHLFLQPLKSQGVYKMEDSAMIVRIKFMTKPGDQFVTRKVVYQEIRDLFENEGIKFAHKEVTVRMADEPETPLTNRQKAGVAAAARSAADDEMQPAAVDDGP